MTDMPVSSPDVKTLAHVIPTRERSTPGSRVNPDLSNRACLEQDALLKDPVR